MDLLMQGVLSPEARARLQVSAWKRWEAVAGKEWTADEWQTHWGIEISRQMKEWDKAYAEWHVKRLHVN